MGLSALPQLPAPRQPPKVPARTGRLAPGQSLADRFTIVRFIAKGGMGEVYEAEDRFLQGVHVALKTILPHIAGDPGLQQSFKREVLLAREVTHPNLCPIYDVFFCEEPAPGSLFLTMKFRPGTTLGARLREPAPIPADEALAILKQIAAGLSAIHGAGIVHRDIKSSNVMLDGRGSDIRIWITDFGLARTNDVETTSSGYESIAGTPAYMAPELFTGKPPSQASDLYAFGVVMHEVFTGQKPDRAADGSSVKVSAKLNTSTTPAYCVQLVKECLDRDPRRRCRAFHDALETLHLEPRKKNLWTRRHFVGTAAAAVCATAGGISWQWDRLENLLHPLPRKRFIALLNWPKTSDSQTAPMVTGAMNAIKTELTHAEAFDHNLFVITPDDVLGQDVTGVTHLADICDPLGANLVLAIACQAEAKDYHVFLRLLDPLTNESLRAKKVICPRSEITTLPERAALATASLLNLKAVLRKNDKTDPGTQSSDAFTAFQAAETFMKQPNDKGLSSAIEKYGEATELDPNYAIAHARMAMAYVRLYDIRRDTAALDLARSNSELAIRLNGSLEDGYLALAAVLDDTGDKRGALDQVGKALAMNPSSPAALLWKANIYSGLDRWVDAEQTLYLVLQQRPNSWVTYNQLGYTLHQQGKYQEALEKFRVASLAAPKSVMALSNMGEACLQVGKFEEGLGYLKKSAALDPTWDVAVSNISSALRYQGKYEEALPYARRATVLNSADDFNWLELGDCYSSLPHRQKDARNAYLRAAQEAERHLQTDGADGPAWMRLALYRIKTGNSREADALVKKAASLGANDVDSQICKARILELLGRRDQALATLSACFQRGVTTFDIALLPDLEFLRGDVRYQEMARLRTQAAPVSHPS